MDVVRIIETFARNNDPGFGDGFLEHLHERRFCLKRDPLPHQLTDPSDADVHVNDVFVGKAVPSDPVARYRKRFRKEKTDDVQTDTVMEGQLVFSISGETTEVRQMQEDKCEVYG